MEDSEVQFDKEEIAPFDFRQHGLDAVEVYREVRPKYEQFTLSLETIITQMLAARDKKVASVQTRAKSLDSFGDKASLPSEVDPNLPKYPHPLTQITDIAGARIIAFFPRTVEELDALIMEQFVIEERSNKGDILEQQERFGYQSVHYLAKLKPARLALPEYARFVGLVAEIQVRTILQHAWAEIEHDIQYKPAETLPSTTKRRFMTLAGLLELADREFQSIQDEYKQLNEQAETAVEAGNLEEVEITPQALKAYLDKKLGPDGRMSAFSYSWTARLLRTLGFTNFQQIDECIFGYDDDRISRIIYKTRAGQLTRFEWQLMASMGENYINRHLWRYEEWFKKSRRSWLEELTEAGISIGAYDPT
jgi:putative GTP pyrophosphokinase